MNDKERERLNEQTNAVLALPDVITQIGVAAQYVADEHYRSFRDNFAAESLFQSPIEAIFAVWCEAVSAANQLDEPFYDVSILTQQSVQTSSGHSYRLDFEIRDKSWYRGVPAIDQAMRLGIPVTKIAVEVDGHEFHEKTREQVAHRNRRDRDLQTDGWKVFHFSGAEIVRDPKRCATEVLTYSARQAQSMWSAVYERLNPRETE